MSLLRREHLHNPESDVGVHIHIANGGRVQLVELLMRRERMLGSEG